MALAAVARVIVVVEPEALVRDAVVQGLRDLGWIVVEASSLAAAKRIVTAEAAAFVIGEPLPDGPPIEFIAHSKIPVILLALDSNAAVAKAARLSGAKAVLSRYDAMTELEAVLGPAPAPPATTAPGGDDEGDGWAAPEPEPPVTPTAPPKPISQSAVRANTGSVPHTDEQLLRSVMQKELAELHTQSYYRVLKVPETATPTEIDEAWRRFDDKWSPSSLSTIASPDMRALAGEIIAVGRAAYGVLSDPRRREAYLAKPRVLAPTLSSPEMDTDDRLALARSLVGKGQGEEARKHLAAILESEPENGTAKAIGYWLGAQERMAQHDFKGAEQAATEALAADPALGEAKSLRDRLVARRTVPRPPPVAAPASTPALSSSVGLPSVSRTLAPGSVLASGKRGPDRRLIIDAIVLCFANSALKDVVGTDALAMVLDARFGQMLQASGTLKLQPLWELLALQEGFVAEQAYPPICRFKSWEDLLNVMVELPNEMGSLSMSQRERHAADCRVPDTELLRLAKASQQPPPATPEAPRPAAATVRPPRANQPTKPAAGASSARPAQNSPTALEERVAERKRRSLLVFLVPVAVLGIALSTAVTLRRPGVHEAEQNVLGAIPGHGAKRAGQVVAAVLDDASWNARPEAQRRALLDQALERSESQGAASFVLTDGKGRIQASAQRDGARIIYFFAPSVGK
jgi:hypothetical protein